jgi:prohibitin 2
VNKVKLGIGAAAVFGVLTALSGCGCSVVRTGERGIETRFGEIQGEPLPEGLHFYNPITSSIKTLDVREEKLEGSTKPFTKDTQTATIHYAVIYSPDPSQIHMLYKKLGEEWAAKIVKPVVEATIQNVIGGEVADDLMAHRGTVQQLAFTKLQEALKDRSVFISGLSITNVDFEDSYEKAVEAKVVAVQHAQEAKNHTIEVQEKAKQSLIAADAEAKSMQIRSQALSQNHGLVEYEAVQRWDGKLPQYMMGSSTPFINISGGK